MSTTLTRWRVVNTLSCARFAVRNLGVRTVTGRVPITSAWVDVDQSDRPTAIGAELDLGGIDTGNARRDRDLRKPALLDLDRHPTLVFSGGPGEHDGEGWQLPGRLSAHGAELDLVLAATVHRTAEGMRVGATTAFDRRALGIKAPRLMIGRSIEVTLEIVLTPL